MRTIKGSPVIIKTKTHGKHLFTLPSVFTITLFVISIIFTEYEAAIQDGDITINELLKLIYLGIGATATYVARGSEGKLGAYTNTFLPGLNKSDFEHEDFVNLDDLDIQDDITNDKEFY